MPHKARSFATLPSPDEAQALLADVATAPCRFAPVTAEGPLGLYGAGDLGRLARDFLKAVGRDFDFVVDRNARELAQAPDWNAVKLLHPDDVPDMAKNDVRLAVSVVTAPYVAIEQSLLQHGFKEVVPFYDVAESFRQQHPLSNGWFAAPLPPEDQKHTARVLAGWAEPTE